MENHSLRCRPLRHSLNYPDYRMDNTVRTFACRHWNIYQNEVGDSAELEIETKYRATDFLGTQGRGLQYPRQENLLLALKLS